LLISSESSDFASIPYCDTRLKQVKNCLLPGNPAKYVWLSMVTLVIGLTPAVVFRSWELPPYLAAELIQETFNDRREPKDTANLNPVNTEL